MWLSLGKDPLAFPKDAVGVFGAFGDGLQATVVPSASDLIDSDRNPSEGPADRNSWYVSASPH